LKNYDDRSVVNGFDYLPCFTIFYGKNAVFTLKTPGLLKHLTNTKCSSIINTPDEKI